MVRSGTGLAEALDSRHGPNASAKRPAEGPSRCSCYGHPTCKLPWPRPSRVEEYMAGGKLSSMPYCRMLPGLTSASGPVELERHLVCLARLPRRAWPRWGQRRRVALILILGASFAFACIFFLNTGCRGHPAISLTLLFLSLKSNGPSPHLFLKLRWCRGHRCRCVAGARPSNPSTAPTCHCWCLFHRWFVSGNRMCPKAT